MGNLRERYYKPSIWLFRAGIIDCTQLETWAPERTSTFDSLEGGLWNGVEWCGMPCFSILSQCIANEVKTFTLDVLNLETFCGISDCGNLGEYGSHRRQWLPECSIEPASTVSWVLTWTSLPFLNTLIKSCGQPAELQNSGRGQFEL